MRWLIIYFIASSASLTIYLRILKMKKFNRFDPKRQSWKPYFIMTGLDLLVIAGVSALCAVAIWLFYVKTM